MKNTFLCILGLLCVSGFVRAEESSSSQKPRSEVERVIDDALPEVQNCYHQEGKTDPAVQGNLFFEIKIDGDGHPQSCRITEKIGSENFGNCVCDVLKTKQFPKSPDGVSQTLTKGFHFSHQK